MHNKIKHNEQLNSTTVHLSCTSKLVAERLSSDRLWGIHDCCSALETRWGRLVNRCECLISAPYRALGCLWEYSLLKSPDIELCNEWGHLSAPTYCRCAAKQAKLMSLILVRAWTVHWSGILLHRFADSNQSDTIREIVHNLCIDYTLLSYGAFTNKQLLSIFLPQLCQH